ncbi:uncharacterized protein LOC135628963 [Musa acuminata AAA Group]|uniref:uncharacterized protein LOC135628963 n=1 Tax=Musa acuminata AAA Group TaxID=214697 RepID=UPI0031E0F397
MPLLMNEDLLQDLVLYKKSHEKAVSSAARSLITLFREICPSLLVKKDRGRPVNPKARPKAYGEVSIATDVPDIELLEHVDNSMTDSSDAEASASDLDDEYDSDAETDKEDDSLEDEEEEDDEVSDEKNEEDLGNSDNIDGEEDDGDDLDDDTDENAAYDEYDSDTKEDVDLSDDNMDISSELDASRKKSSNDICNDDDLSNHECACDDNDEIKEEEKAKSKKRKFAARSAIPYRTGVSIWARYRYGTVYRAVHPGVPLGIFRRAEHCSTATVLQCCYSIETVTDGPRTGSLSDRYIPPVPGGTDRYCRPWFADYVGQLNTSESSLRTLKRLTMAKMSQKASDETDGILSNEDFQRIKELKAKKEAKLVMAQQGLLRKGIDSKVSSFKIPSSEQLSIKPVDPAMLEVHIKRKLSKEERLALVRAGREDRGKY